MFVANITTAMTKASEKMFEILDKDGTLRGGSLKPNQVNEELNKTWPARELMKKNIRCSSIKKIWDKRMHKEMWFVERQLWTSPRGQRSY